MKSDLIIKLKIMAKSFVLWLFLGFLLLISIPDIFRASPRAICSACHSYLNTINADLPEDIFERFSPGDTVPNEYMKNYYGLEVFSFCLYRHSKLLLTKNGVKCSIHGTIDEPNIMTMKKIERWHFYDRLFSVDNLSFVSVIFIIILELIIFLSNTTILLEKEERIYNIIALFYLSVVVVHHGWGFFNHVLLK